MHPIKFSETLAGILQCGGIAQQGSASGCNGAPDGGSIVRCTRSRTVSIARPEIRAEETKIMLVTECLSKELFKGKTVFVTGGGSGINLGVAKNFAALGAKVAICGRTQE